MTYTPEFAKPGPSSQRQRAGKKVSTWRLVRDKKIAESGPVCAVCREWCFGGIEDPSIFREMMGKEKFSWKAIEAHHIVSRAQGGSNEEENMQLLCPRHHRGNEGKHG